MSDHIGHFIRRVLLLCRRLRILHHVRELGHSVRPTVVVVKAGNLLILHLTFYVLFALFSLQKKRITGW